MFLYFSYDGTCPAEFAVMATRTPGMTCKTCFLEARKCGVQCAKCFEKHARHSTGLVDLLRCIPTRLTRGSLGPAVSIVKNVLGQVPSAWNVPVTDIFSSV